MTHPHLQLSMIVGGTELHPDYCLADHGGWTISMSTNSLVLGHGIPRTHIPLGNIWEFSLYAAPDTCVDEPQENVEAEEWQDGHDEPVGVVLAAEDVPWTAELDDALALQWPSASPGRDQHL
jgi:hypothetical protein